MDAPGRSAPLSLTALLSIGTAIFAMHFGASSMLWPATWGRDSGVDWLPAFFGYFFTGIMLPVLGYIAVTKGGPLFALAGRVGPRFALLFGGLTVFILGPLFAIPRMSAAAWDAVIHVLGIDAGDSSRLPSYVFTIFYYVAIYWFIHNKAKIVDKLSHILVPALVLLEAALIISCIVSPVGESAARNYSRSPFGFGFVSGYQGLDLPAALILSGLILADIKARGLTRVTDVMRALFIGMCIGFSLFGLVMFGEFFRGHTASGVFTDTFYAKLSADIVLRQWGIIGGSVFNIALMLACITAAVGLTAGTADFIQTASKNSVRYKAGCIFTLILSGAISLAGLKTIVALSAPILNFIYPPSIALVLCVVFFPKRLNLMRGACFFSLGFGFLEAVHGYLGLLGLGGVLTPFFALVPGASDGLGFVSFLLAGAVLGILFLKNTEAAPLTL